ncbi:DUF433 domain-containing protein [Lentzea sp. NPDC004789]
MGEVVSLLDRPVYTFREVDRLLGLNQDTTRRWVDGYRRAGKHYAPIVREESTGDRWVTWGEFTEVRLLSEYRDLDHIRIQKLRIVVDHLRQEFGHRYPLAYAQPFLLPNGREILMRAQHAAQLEDDLFVVVRTGQLVVTPRVERFVRAATYEVDPVRPQEGKTIAVRFQADPRYPDVAIDPEHRSGRPTIVGRSILVTTLAEMVFAGDQVEDIAAWYELTPDQVQQAVDFTATHNLVA